MVVLTVNNIIYNDNSYHLVLLKNSYLPGDGVFTICGTGGPVTGFNTDTDKCWIDFMLINPRINVEDEVGIIRKKIAVYKANDKLRMESNICGVKVITDIDTKMNKDYRIQMNIILENNYMRYLILYSYGDISEICVDLTSGIVNVIDMAMNLAPPPANNTYKYKTVKQKLIEEEEDLKKRIAAEDKREAAETQRELAAEDHGDFI